MYVSLLILPKSMIYLSPHIKITRNYASYHRARDGTCDHVVGLQCIWEMHPRAYTHILNFVPVLQNNVGISPVVDVLCESV